jgi:hypothetical protein
MKAEAITIQKDTFSAFGLQQMKPASITTIQLYAQEAYEYYNVYDMINAVKQTEYPISSPVLAQQDL